MMKERLEGVGPGMRYDRMTVREVAELTGITPRTLQYYDKIGLLKATAYTQSGYRLYDAAALERLQQILLFRELEFPLKDIKQILGSPDFDRDKALQQQIELLQMKKAHIETLITLARGIQNTGGRHMDFSAFDKTTLNRYAQEAKTQWGQTEAYGEFEEKSKGRSEATQEALGRGLMEIFARMGALKGGAPESEAAQELVKQLQTYITEHFYRCTDQILSGLGRMYAAGGEFTQNIDAAGGEGTAEFANAAIQIHCAKASR